MLKDEERLMTQAYELLREALKSPTPLLSEEGLGAGVVQVA